MLVEDVHEMFTEAASGNPREAPAVPGSSSLQGSSLHI